MVQTFLRLLPFACVILNAQNNVHSTALPKLIIDSDGVVDDVAAIMMLVANQNVALNITMITSGTGTTDAINATRNILKALEVTNMLGKIPVYKGSEKYISKLNLTDYYYGRDGFGDAGIERPSIRLISNQSAIDKIIEVITANPGEIIIFSIGTFTNIARAIEKYPNLLSAVKRIYYLGDCGSKQYGEHNTFFDKEAYRIFEQHSSKLEKFVINHTDVINVYPSKKWWKKILYNGSSEQLKLLARVSKMNLMMKKKFGLIDSFVAAIYLYLSGNSSHSLEGISIKHGCGEGATSSHDTKKILSKLGENIFKKIFVDNLGSNNSQFDMNMCF